VQYRWRNLGYGSFDEFLAALVSRKRRAIKKERRCATHNGVRLRVLRGDDIKPTHWDTLFDFYLATTDRKWSRAYLTRAFFHRIGASMGERIALVVALKDDQLVAGALNLVGEDALFGRYWGCRPDQRRQKLHFETCYYQAIELAIELGLSRVEAGAQGEHKIQRGYLPEPTYSAHWIADPLFRDTIASFLMRERTAVAREIAMLTEHSPFRTDRSTAPDYMGASMR